MRMIAVLLLWLAVLLAVVVLRSETTRLHYEIASQQQQADNIRHTLRQAELELARLRNPMLLRQRVENALRQYTEDVQEDDPAPAPD